MITNRKSKVPIDARDTDTEERAVEAWPEDAHLLKSITGKDGRVLVKSIDKIDEARLDNRLDRFHHPKVVVDDPATWIASINGNIAWMRVAVEEAMAAELLEIRGCEPLRHEGQIYILHLFQSGDIIDFSARHILKD